MPIFWFQYQALAWIVQAKHFFLPTIIGIDPATSIQTNQGVPSTLVSMARPGVLPSLVDIEDSLDCARKYFLKYGQVAPV